MLNVAGFEYGKVLTIGPSPGSFEYGKSMTIGSATQTILQVYVRVSGVWKAVQFTWARVDGVWTAVRPHANVSDSWR